MRALGLCLSSDELTVARVCAGIQPSIVFNFKLARSLGHTAAHSLGTACAHRSDPLSVLCALMTLITVSHSTPSVLPLRHSHTDELDGRVTSE